MNKIKFFTIFCLFVLALTSSFGQSSVFDTELELQVYPTGLIPGLRLEKGFANRNAIHLRIGYNIVRHGDAGVHQKEEGGGFGFSLGYRRYLKADFEKWFLGARTDFWFNSIDWEDDINTQTASSGNSKITVFQPTAEFGYLLLLKSGEWFITPSIAAGVEVNIKTKGAETGQGIILLLGLSIGKRF